MLLERVIPSAALQQLVGGARTGTGGAVFLPGEPGIGKTTLLGR